MTASKVVRAKALVTPRYNQPPCSGPWLQAGQGMAEIDLISADSRQKLYSLRLYGSPMMTKSGISSLSLTGPEDRVRPILAKASWSRPNALVKVVCLMRKELTSSPPGSICNIDLWGPSWIMTWQGPAT
ncbi:hypothetical protein V6Z96_005229 [Aspergillus fumigatus]